MRFGKINTFRIIETPSFKNLPKHRIEQIYDFYKIESMNRSKLNKTGDTLIDHNFEYTKPDFSFLKK